MTDYNSLRVSDMHIDIETYSRRDIRKTGSYKYFECPDFEILMICYSYDHYPEHIISLAEGEEIPEHFIKNLLDPRVRKLAHNANFERNAFKRVGLDVPSRQWFCTAVKASYCGLPLSLDDISKALKFSADKAKLATGKKLIRYFCMPCKPTKVNGGRTRNYWHHDLEKWEQFKEYCRGDVRAEKEIEHVLQNYDIPEIERELYFLDQHINDRGIEIDLDFVNNIIAVDDAFIQTHVDFITTNTNIKNPNSATEIKRWLLERTGKVVKSIAKEHMSKLIEDSQDALVREVLIRKQKLSNTSLKKYRTMLTCVCDDDRVRGLLMFYGANRTGRWAGRLVQVQNLPRNYLKNIAQVKEDFKHLDFDVLSMMYDDLNKVMSQLIRTAFIAGDGKTYVVDDFSAIEARVTAWLANEKWRLDIFNTHGKIYEASASMMFGVPIEKVTKGSPLRDQGKVAELALGYGGGVNALTEMDFNNAISEKDKPRIVSLWREKSPNIVALWKDVEVNAKRALRRKNRVQISKYRGLEFMYDGVALTIKLPSGRKLFYWNPSFTTNKWGNKTIQYKGLNQKSKKWWNITTYGGKLVENIVQAISRDVLAQAMLNLHNEGFDIDMHIHDEAVMPVLLSESQYNLNRVNKIMSQPMDWAPELPLEADGYITPFYKKD